MCDLPVISLQSRCNPIAKSMPSHCDLTLISLQSHCVISLCDLTAISQEDVADKIHQSDRTAIKQTIVSLMLKSPEQIQRQVRGSLGLFRTRVSRRKLVPRIDIMYLVIASQHSFVTCTDIQLHQLYINDVIIVNHPDCFLDLISDALVQ